VGKTWPPEIVSYVHLFDSCTQDWYAVYGILTHLLKIVKADRPDISRAYLRGPVRGGLVIPYP